MNHEQLYEELTLTIEVDNFGNKYWRNKKGQFHRTYGPAIVYSNGSQFWYQNGLPHRIGSPAIEWASGAKEWWINGSRIK